MISREVEGHGERRTLQGIIRFHPSNDVASLPLFDPLEPVQEM